MPDEPARTCPSCGAQVAARFCGVCGTDLGVPPAAAAGDVPLLTHGAASGRGGPAAPSAGSDDPATQPLRPVRPRTEGPVAATPGLFPTEALRAPGARAWSQVPDRPAAPGLFPGWTGMQPAVPVAPPAGSPRRRALVTVLAVAAATAVVVLVALLVAPRWSGNTAQPDPQVTAVPATSPAPSTAPPPTVATTPVTSPSPSATPSTPPSATAGSTASGASAPSTPAPTGTGGTGVPPETTVTVTATATASGTGRAPGSGTAGSRTAPGTAPAPRTPAARPTRPSGPAVLPLGVPRRDIGCGSGWVVQLASELTPEAFRERVAALRAAGQLPAGARAAVSTASCRIFSNQANTYVLYAGPFGSPYDGCAARLAGPPDAYIKGDDPQRALDYVSCLCPADTARLPAVVASGQRGVWVGELQRSLAGHLGYRIGDLQGHWGTYTAGTRAAVVRFQAAAGLPPTGRVDGSTWRAVRAAQC
ncbi:peptidoglycan-binding domain-containing protein [Nakamurella endophytica]|uniref:Peptidoglycan binding-like domain-containing protein n=1 Tax=Nakamurella endophytica TaxID=1748367 RepID=A0A917WET4_9ACTN|nr:peptidoglycan-binding domain-containing protein [Nakamurella endophytica]GGL96631.1 hypothetical protein GCM10011594_15440 [Nakamurella endophytica]